DLTGLFQGEFRPGPPRVAVKPGERITPIGRDGSTPRAGLDFAPVQLLPESWSPATRLAIEYREVENHYRLALVTPEETIGTSPAEITVERDPEGREAMRSEAHT